MKETTKPTTANKHKYTKMAATDSDQLAAAKFGGSTRFPKLGSGQIVVSL
ncbi:hypothetical protein ES703_98906 [subsurface metagenome]